jgi:uncharacterized iron-regulated membrane protein
MGVLAVLFVFAALLLFASAGLMWWDDFLAARRARPRRPASSYKAPPKGPGPGGKR